MEEDADLLEILDAHFDERLKGIHTAMPAKIVAYNPATMTATIQPLFKVQYQGEKFPKELPKVQDVPIIMSRTASTLSFAPIKAGDLGLAIFCEGDISAYMLGKGDSTFPDDSRRNNLSDAYFIPGGYPELAVWKGLPPPSGAAGIALANGGKLYFGTGVPIAPTDAKTDLVSIMRKLAEWIALMNAAHAGAGTIPVAEVTAGISNIIAALQSMET